MLSNMTQQLKDLGLEHRLPEVLEESGRVRAELGYPVMVTPFSQFVGVQATINIIEGKRYNTVPEDIRLYARGHYGRPVAPLDPQVQELYTPTPALPVNGRWLLTGGRCDHHQRLAGVHQFLIAGEDCE